MAEQRKYKTKQREAVSAYLAQHCERYFSVDDVWSAVSADGARIGRSTVYRCLEAMATDGSALKATTPLALKPSISSSLLKSTAPTLS